MKIYLLTLTVIYLVFVMNSAHANTLNVKVTNIDTQRPGNILVMLFNEDGFPKDHAKALDIITKPAITDTLDVSFTSVPDYFALKVLHDEDETGEVSKNWTSIIPSEGLGFSNGAKLSFGPPKFDKAKVQYTHDSKSLSIKIIYP